MHAVEMIKTKDSCMTDHQIQLFPNMIIHLFCYL